MHNWNWDTLCFFSFTCFTTFLMLKSGIYRVSQFQLCNFERVLRIDYLRFFKWINRFIKLQYWRNFYKKFDTLLKIIRVWLHFFQSATFWKEWEKCINLNVKELFFKLNASKQVKSRFIRFEISRFLILRKCFFNDNIIVRQFDRWPFQRASTWQLDHRIIG